MLEDKFMDQKDENVRSCLFKKRWWNLLRVGIGEIWEDFMFRILLRTTKEFFSKRTDIEQWKQKNEKWIGGENDEGGSVGEKAIWGESNW